MKTWFILVLAVISNSFLFGQDCYCPKNSLFQETKENPDKIYTFSNGKKLAICGDGEIESDEKVWSEFTISQCGADSALLEFDAIQSCAVEQNKDTLVIQEYYNIANGRNMSLQWTKFYVTKLYWENSHWVRRGYYRKDLKKYSKDEIETALREYDTAKEEKDYDGDKILLIGYRLFWAYVSGSEKAGQYLENLELKFGGTDGFDGAIKEDSDDLKITYESYKEGK